MKSGRGVLDSKIARVIKRIVKAIFPSLDPHSYLKRVTGVIHVGANLEHVPPELNRQDSHGVLDRRFYRH